MMVVDRSGVAAAVRTEAVDVNSVHKAIDHFCVSRCSSSVYDVPLKWSRLHSVIASILTILSFRFFFKLELMSGHGGTIADVPSDRQKSNTHFMGLPTPSKLLIS